jgi:hypothetical protein
MAVVILMRRRSAIAAFVVLTLGLPALAQEPLVDFYHDFRGRPLPPELAPFQVDDPGFFQLEPAGLRLTLPKAYLHPNKGVGCQVTRTLRGDFDVTATVDFHDVEIPSAGGGAGIGLSVNGATADVQLRRHVGSGGKHWVMAVWHFRVRDKGGTGLKQFLSPCTEQVLRLRLKREGETVQCLWAPPDAGDNFKKIRHIEFGTQDIESVRLFAFNNQVPCRVDVRALDLRIRGLGPAGTENRGRFRGRLWLVLGILVLCVAGAVIAVRFARRRLNGAVGIPARDELDEGSNR